MGYFEDNLSINAMGKRVDAQLAADRLASANTEKPAETKPVTVPIASTEKQPVGDTVSLGSTADDSKPAELTPQTASKEVKPDTKADDFNTVISNWSSLDEASKKKFLASIDKNDINAEQVDALNKLTENVPKEEATEISAALRNSHMADREFVGPTQHGLVALNADNKLKDIAANPDTGNAEKTTKLVKTMANDKRLSEEHHEILAKEGISKVQKKDQLEVEKEILESKVSTSNVRNALAEGITKFDKDNQEQAAKDYTNAKQVTEENRSALARNLHNFHKEKQVKIMQDFVANDKVTEQNRTTVAQDLPQFAADNQETAAQKYLECSKVTTTNKIALADVLGKFDDAHEVNILNNFLENVKADTIDNTEIRNHIASSLPTFAVDNQVAAAKMYNDCPYVNEENRNTFAEYFQYFDSSTREQIVQDFNDCQYVTAENEERLSRNISSLSKTEQDEINTIMYPSGKEAEYSQESVTTALTLSDNSEIAKTVCGANTSYLSDKDIASISKIIGIDISQSESSPIKSLIECINRNPDKVSALMQSGFSAVLKSHFSDLSLSAQYKFIFSSGKEQILAMYEQLPLGAKALVKNMFMSNFSGNTSLAKQIKSNFSVKERREIVRNNKSRMSDLVSMMLLENSKSSTLAH